MKKILFIIAVIACWQGSLYAGDLVCTLSLDKAKVAPGKQAQLTLTIDGANDAGAAEPPPMNFDPRISSQMLLKFFTPSTNGPAAGVVAPLEFAPPSPPKPPSSTATYSN